MYLVNPSGRTVAIDDEKEYQELLQKGFRKATDQEEADFILKQSEKIALMQYEAEATYDSEKGIYFATVTMGGKDGYGIAAQNMMREFYNLGIMASTYQKGQKIGFLFHSPQSLIRLENPFKIVYTMFESDKIPEDWKEYLDAADEVIVPSKWCAEVFAKAGINTRVLPLGYDQNIFKFVERPLKHEARQDFTFLHYNAFNIRKGFLEVYEAFRKAFDPSEPVKLVLKTTLKDAYQRFPYVSPTKDPKIIVIQDSINERELLKLHEESDCFIFPSRGEGFGITPLEAMATGLPVIVPNAHGISEYFNPEYMYEVKVEKTCPAIYARYKGQDVGNMVVCDTDDLARQMRYIYEHEQEAKEKGRKAAEYAKNFTFEKTALGLKEIFDEYFGRPAPTKQKSGMLTLEKVR